MAVFHLDTSAVIKRYRTEKGSDFVNELYSGLTDEEALATSYLTCLEVEAVAARMRKGRLLSDDAYAILMAAFSRDIEQLVYLDTSAVLETARPPARYRREHRSTDTPAVERT